MQSMKEFYDEFAPKFLELAPKKEFIDNYIDYVDNTLVNEFCQNLYELEMTKFGIEQDVPKLKEEMEELNKKYSEKKKELEALGEDADMGTVELLKAECDSLFKRYKGKVNTTATIENKKDMLETNIRAFTNQIEQSIARKKLLQELGDSLDKNSQ